MFERRRTWERVEVELDANMEEALRLLALHSVVYKDVVDGKDAKVKFGKKTDVGGKPESKAEASLSNSLRHRNHERVDPYTSPPET